MNEILFSILAGIIQGLTEFLPVSSSGHLVVFHDLFGFEFVNNLAFDAILHLGTLAAILGVFLPEFWRYFLAGLQSLKKWDLRNNKEQLLAWYILVATMPVAIIGLLFGDFIESALRNLTLVGIMLIVFGILLYLADGYSAKVKTISQLSFFDSLLVGLAQVLALVPGVSRSGITIIAGLSRKLNRPEAARFSFLISAPIILGAGAKKIFDLTAAASLNSADLAALALGFIASAATGYLVIKFFLKFLQSHSLKVFAVYRIILGILILSILFFK